MAMCKQNITFNISRAVINGVYKQATIQPLIFRTLVFGCLRKLELLYIYIYTFLLEKLKHFFEKLNLLKSLGDYDSSSFAHDPSI